MIEDWDREGFDARLADRARVLVLFYADWCPFSQRFLPTFGEREADANVAFARADLKHPLDPRWDAYGIHVVPTLVYFEHGEELERSEAVRDHGLRPRDLEDLLHFVDSIEEEPRLPKRMHGPRRT